MKVTVNGCMSLYVGQQGSHISPNVTWDGLHPAHDSQRISFIENGWKDVSKITDSYKSLLFINGLHLFYF